MSDTKLGGKDRIAISERRKWELPFRGGVISVWSDTDAGTLAVIAQLSLADPRYDAFYKAAEVTLKDTEGRIVFPPSDEASSEADDVLALFS